MIPKDYIIPVLEPQAGTKSCFVKIIQSVQRPQSELTFGQIDQKLTLDQIEPKLSVSNFCPIRPEVKCS